MVNHLQRALDTQLRAVCGYHLPIRREDRHAGADSRLSQIDGCDVALLEYPKGLRQPVFEPVAELRRRCHRGGIVRWAAHQQDRRRKRVRRLLDAFRPLCAQWPCGRDLEPRVDNALQQRFPSRARPAVFGSFGLLVAVVDRHRELRVLRRSHLHKSFAQQLFKMFVGFSPAPAKA